MSNRSQRKAVVLICAIAITAVLTIAIANTLNKRQERVNLQNEMIRNRPQYDSIDRIDTEDGYAIAVQNNLKGAVDLEGKVLLPFKYDSVYQSHASKFLIAKKNNLSDLYSLTDKKIILQELDNISSFLGKYRIATKNGKQGIIDIQGKINIPVKYNRVVPFSLKSESIVSKNDERDDESAIIATFENGKQGAFDFDNNRLTIPPKYDRIDYINSRDNYAIVVKDGQTGIYDPRRDLFTPLKYDRLELLSADEYARHAVNREGKDLTTVKSNAALLLKEDNQTRLLLGNFYAYHLDYAIATQNGKQGILKIDNSEVVIPLEYDKIKGYSNNLDYVIVNKAGKQGILKIDNSEVVVPLEYDEIQGYSNNLDYAIATKAGKLGVVNIRDRSFIAIEADKLNNSLLDRGYVIFSQNGQEGIANLAGEIIIPPQFHLEDDELDSVGIRTADGTYLIANKNERLGILNLQTKKFMTLDYDEISNGGNNVDLEPGYLIAIKDEKSGIINLEGNIVVPLAEKRIEGFFQGVVWRRDYNDRQPQITSSQPDKNRSDRDLFINDLAVLTVNNRYSISCVVNRHGKILFPAWVYHNWGVEEKVDNICRSLTGTEVDNDLIDENSNPVEVLYGAKYGADLAPGIGTYASLIDNGMIKIHVNNRWGYANAKGNVVIYPQFDDAKAFAEDLAAIKQDGKWGYIDRAGKIVIPPQFDEAESFANGVAVVKQGYTRNIDPTGKTLP